ncbi:apolipoprotein D and lipocalin family protein [Aliiroseovarius halocynthiae]|nr:lipocalin family protein [Aliiroseovarius halocynthiae]SMR71444.1 apolipoprotein D and lipocalin family protein [Aliiroseovarius halocynthiae]
MIDRRKLLTIGGSALVGSALPACVSNNDGFEFHRDTSRRLSSTTRFDAARFAGQWVIRGEFVHPGQPPLYGTVAIEHGAKGITGISISSGASGRERYDARMDRAGRITVGKQPFATQYWVLWVDADYRTAAIGTPSGSFGWIIDRNRKGGDDRIKAAADVMIFNGYAKSRLKLR